jgi:hypothetical protein
MTGPHPPALPGTADRKPMALPADDAAWERGRGWALDFGLRCAAYAAGNRLLSEIGRYTVGQVLAG